MTRFLTALCLLALVGPLAGCDLTEEQDTFDGPTVQFGASSLTAPEGDASDIVVTLTGAAPGQTVTFDVLFAAQASSACAEGDVTVDNGGDCTPPQTPTEADTVLVDFTGFGTPATNGNRVQSVSLTAGADGTASATLPVVVRNEGLVEGVQTAVFAIQNLSEGARLGATRQISLIIGTLPIGTIRTLPDAALATVEGIVTRTRGRLTYIQDATGAIAIFSPVGTPLFDAVAAGEISPGDRIQVAGAIDIFRGLTEIVFVTGFEVINEDEGLLTPQTVTLSQLVADLESYESELIRVANLTFQTTDVAFVVTNSGVNYTVVDPAGTTYTLRVVGGSDGTAGANGGTPIPTVPATFTGVVGQFDTGQLLLTNRSELTP